MTQQDLLNQVESDLKNLLERLRAQFLTADEAQLTRRPEGKKAWNALECFDHLNRHCADYFDLIERAIHKSKARNWTASPDLTTKSGFWGSMMLNSLTTGKRRKTPGRYRPKTSEQLNINTVKSLIINSERLLRIIQMARQVDLNRSKVRFAGIPAIKLKLSDLLPFIVRHIQRHTDQAEKAKA